MEAVEVKKPKAGAVTAPAFFLTKNPYENALLFGKLLIKISVRVFKVLKVEDNMAGKKLKDMKLFSLSSNRPLAEEIAEELGVELGKVETTTFADGEVRINIEESIRGDNVYIIQSTNAPSNDHLMEVLIMVDALRRASARKIDVMIPYYGYARQDRKERPRESITAKLVANLLTIAGVNRVIAMDLHSPQIQGFFDIPVDHLSGVALMANYFLDHDLVDEKTVVVSPDHAGVTRAREMAELLNTPLAIIDKRSTEIEDEDKLHVIGEVEGYRCIMYDDLIDTGKTSCMVNNVLKNEGAKEVYVGAVHPVFSNNAAEILEQSSIEKVIVTNTIELPAEKRFAKLDQISAAPLLAEAIKRIHEFESVKPLFDTDYVKELTSRFEQK